MTKDEKISNFERVLSWLPEAFKSWATSNPFLSSTLNEVLNERDTRLSGTPCTSRLKTAVTALLQKLQDRRDKSAALILAASREAEETAFTLASRMSEGTDLRIAATTGVRDGAGLTAIFAAAPDLVVTNPKVLEKVFDKGFAAPEAFRTILVDGAEWHDVIGDTDLIASLIERFPTARQLIVTGPVVVETTEDPYNAMLHAPAYCRAPDEAAREAAPKERVVLVPEEKMSETLAREAEKTPVLFLVSTPTESTRVTGLLKEAGIAAKRAAATQSASARETLVLKFIAGRVEHLVMPHSVIGELEHNRASRVILTDLSGGPEPYLEHLALTADGTGELVTIVTPETLPLFEKLLVAAEKRLTLENPYNLPEPRTVIGQLLRREKLTIRTNYGRTAESAEGAAPEQAQPRKPRKSFKERRFGKNRPFKQRQEDAAETTSAPVEAQSAPAAEAGATPVLAPQEGAPAEAGAQDKPRKGHFKTFRRKSRKFQNGEGEASRTQEKPVQNAGSEQAPAGDKKPQEKKTFERKAFEKKPYEKKPFEKKRDRKKPARQDAEAKPRQQDWDDDNFGNSIHYQPKRQNLRGLSSDQQIHWEPTDPYHPSSQALSLPQIMPDENRRGGYVNGYVNGNVNGNVKGSFNRSRRNYRKKREG